MQRENLVPAGVDDLADLLERHSQLSATCDVCAISSDKVEVKACSSPAARHTGPCPKKVCLYCVMTAQRDQARHQYQEHEMHYCRPCSEAIQAQQRGEHCQCDLQTRRDVLDQSRTEWQCPPCRSLVNDMLERDVNDNLWDAETEGRVYPRDQYEDGHASLKRWLDPADANRNLCPGCGCDYDKIVQSFIDAELDETGYLPKSLVRQCMLCLGQKL